MDKKVGVRYTHIEEGYVIEIKEIWQDWLELTYKEISKPDADGICSFEWFEENFTHASAYDKQKQNLRI